MNLLELMDALDKGTNLFGPLRPDIRARLYAVASDPTEATWDDAHCIIVNGDRFLTLWQACGRYAGYRVNSKPCDGPWPSVPTQDQIVTALCAAVGHVRT